MSRGPRRKRGDLWAWVYCAVFGVEERGTDVNGGSAESPSGEE